MSSLPIAPLSMQEGGGRENGQRKEEPSSPQPAAAAQEESSIHKLAKIIPRSKDLPWYQATYGSRLTASTRDLLENYAKIPPEDISTHIYQIRDQAWAVFPFPCIGEFWFLTLGLSAHPRYTDLLTRLTSAPDKSQPLLIDLGTCLGQDLRKLVHDGASPTQLFGIDIFPAFEAVGHAFFRDSESFTDRFAAADLFSDSGPLAQTRGTWAVVSSCMFLHSFDWTGQLAACKAMLQLATKKPGSCIIGGLTASIDAREQELKPPFVPEGVKRSVYLQSRESFARLWDEVRSATGVEFKLWAEYDDGESESKKAHEGGAGNFFGGSGQKLLWFWVEIL